jgi:polynucleotide 5'-hydroxyl-kinase GRC3/NOL9
VQDTAIVVKGCKESAHPRSNFPSESRSVPSLSPDPVSALLEATAGRGVVMLLGAPDTGKTTLARSLANAAVSMGVATAIVDADIGQSEIGPPGTIGLASVREAIASLDLLRPSALAFVGSSSPARHLLPMVVGTKRLVERAREEGAELVIVDTCGLVEGELAHTLQIHTIDLVRPDLIVALQRERELEPLLRLASAGGGRIERRPVAAAARPKSEALRRALRAARFHRYFEGARPHELDGRALPIAGAWLFSGAALEPRLLKFAERTLGAPAPYGERLPGAVRLVTRARTDERRLGALQEEFRRQRVLVTPPHTFQGLLVGLMEAGGLLAAVGILEAVTYDSARLTVRAPLRSAAQVCQIRFGRLRIRPDGSEIGVVRPGDL